MRETRIENGVEIYATNLANKTKYMSANAKERKKKGKIMKTCNVYH
jgi:hypothetical protein